MGTEGAGDDRLLGEWNSCGARWNAVCAALNEKGMIAQLSMSETRQIAMDMLVMASRTETDAMIVKFFSKFDLPKEAASGMLVEFRDFRAELDADEAERSTDANSTE